MTATVYQLDHYRPVWRDCWCVCNLCAHEWTGHIHMLTYIRDIQCPRCKGQHTTVKGASDPEVLPPELRCGA